MPKTALITGSSSGIGEATAIIFAKAGWNVVATSRKPDPTQFKEYDNIFTYPLDVTSADSIKSAFSEAVLKFKSIDVVVNNAGYSLDGVFESMDDEQIRKQFDTNLFGVMKVTKQAIKHMRPKKSGTIIQISSMGGRITFPLYSAYHSSKWAVEGFTESLSYELRTHGIKLKLIEPGRIKTNFYSTSKVSVEPKKSLGYQKLLKNHDNLAKGARNNGVDPVKVAKKIYKAATDNKSKLRYMTGSPAPALLILRKVLPERLFFFLIRKTFKIK